MTDEAPVPAVDPQEAEFKDRLRRMHAVAPEKPPVCTLCGTPCYKRPIAFWPFFEWSHDCRGPR